MSSFGSSFGALDHVTEAEFSQNWPQINLNIWRKNSFLTAAVSNMAWQFLEALHHRFS